MTFLETLGHMVVGGVLGVGTTRLYLAARPRIARWLEGNPCAAGHDWKHIGGRNAGCCRDCCCSVPVHECRLCGDCDYGDNAEARATLERCDVAAAVRSCDCQGGFDQPGEIKYRSNDCPVHGEVE